MLGIGGATGTGSAVGAGLAGLVGGTRGPCVHGALVARTSAGGASVTAQQQNKRHKRGDDADEYASRLYADSPLVGLYAGQKAE